MEIYKQIFESLPEALLVVDPDGRIIQLNPPAERMFGYDREELPGQMIEILVPHLLGKHLSDLFSQLAEKGVWPVDAGPELFGRRKDSSEFPVDITLNEMQVEGATQLLCAVRDITEQKHADEKFRGLLESAPDAMVIVNDQGRVVLSNSQTEKVFGYSAAELVGQPLEMLIPERLRSPRHGQHYFMNSHALPPGSKQELFGLHKDGTEFPVEISQSPLGTAEGTLYSTAIRDITERKVAERRVAESLAEKEVLLREIHHRVKNNLAVISSLFYLQSTYTEDDATIKIMQECMDRVRSMALVHETLYESENLAAVDFAQYALSLSKQLVTTYSLPGANVHLKADMEPVTMNLDVAVPCALILNEVMTNTLKHAYPPGHNSGHGAGAGGEVRLALRREHDGACVLEVSDKGVGLPADLDFDSTNSLGLRLIRSLTRQIDANFVLRSTHPGTQARLTLRLEGYADSR